MYLIFEITKIIFGIVLFLIIRHFLSSYLNEKGKNIATKEDIEGITEKIENIKFEVSNLHFQKNELLEKRKLALLEYFELFVEFAESSVKNISFIDTFIYMPDKINEKTNKIIEKKGEVEKAMWKLLIYEFQDQKFIDNIKIIYLKELQYYYLTIDFLWAVENNSLLISHNQLTKELVEKRKELKDEFVNKRDNLEITTIKLPNSLLKIITPKYLELFK